MLSSYAKTCFGCIVRLQINKAVEQRREEIMNPENIPDAEAGKKIRVRFRDVSHFNLWVGVVIATPLISAKYSWSKLAIAKASLAYPLLTWKLNTDSRC